MRAVDVSNEEIVHRAATGFTRQRMIIRLIESSDALLWTCDEGDRVTSVDGGALSIDHRNMIGRDMAECAHSEAYHYAREALSLDNGRDSVRVIWKTPNRRWFGTFSRTYSAGRRTGISAVAIPMDEATSINGAALLG